MAISLRLHNNKAVLLLLSFLLMTMNLLRKIKTL